MPRRDAIQRMLEKEPDDIFLNFSLAMELSKEGLTDQALAQFDRVMSLEPSYTAAYFQKANALIGATRVPEARECLRNGIMAAQKAGGSHTASEMRGVLDGLG